MRGLPLLQCLAALLVAGCVAPAAPPATNPQSTGQALAQFACPHRILEASAWINYMPGPNRSPRQLTIEVKLAEPSDTAVMLRSPASTGETLVLEIRTAPAAPVPGRLGYRESVPDPLYKRISFFCRGAEIHSVDRIERVY
jgi:hypothetical protein